MGKSKLEELGDEYRKQNLIKNEYQKSESGKYSVTHPNAISDGDNKGKGTSTVGDTNNGGSDIDINGNPEIPKSGRNQQLSMNLYNADSPYRNPDTDDNTDQFRSV